MRLRLLLLLLAAPLATGAPTPAERTATVQRLTNEARATHLLEAATDDITAHHSETALKKIEQAEALKPGDAEILNAKGAALTELKRLDEAGKAYAAALAAAPDSFAPQFNQADLLILQKKYSDAVVGFTVLISRFGATPLLKYKLYLSYVLAGRTEKAQALLDNMQFPADGSAWYFANAVDRLQAGKKSEARKLIATATAIDEDDAATYRDSLRDAGLMP